jgi:hypothetical protein
MLSKYFTSHHEGMIRDMHRDGHSLQQIAARLGRMPEVVDHYARGLGLRLVDDNSFAGVLASQRLPRASVEGGVAGRISGVRELPRGMDG